MVTECIPALVMTLARHARKTREFTVILAREEAPPAGEKPVEWLLLTNEPVTTLDDAVVRIGWYRHRSLVSQHSKWPNKNLYSPGSEQTVA